MFTQYLGEVLLLKGDPNAALAEIEAGTERAFGA